MAESDRQPSTEESEERQAELAVLREENERLRAAYADATRTRHRRTALGFALVGIGAIVGALLVPDARGVLFALGGTGLFVGILVQYLTPERFVAASVGRDVYAALAANERAIAAELGLAEERVYVPLADDRVRLFVPQHADYDVPADDALADAFVVTAAERERGLSLRPSGARLVDEYERAAAAGLADSPGPVATALAESLVEQFEVLDSVSVDAEPGRVTVAASGSAFGPATDFDHPVGSTLATGLARGLGEPVTLSVAASADASADWRVTCRWEEGTDGTNERDRTAERGRTDPTETNGAEQANDTDAGGDSGESAETATGTDTTTTGDR